MQKLIVEGEKKIDGEIVAQGAKNSSLPLLCACVLINGKVTLHNCPKLSDVYAATRILTCLGCKCKREDESVIIDSTDIKGYDVPDDLMREMRSSIVFLGAILGKMGKCKLSFPGGCELGPRPIDMHISALKKMGAVINEEHGVLDCFAPNGIKGKQIVLDFPSVGATENIMLASVLAKGETVIKNAAREPEILDLANFLSKCGARIFGAGTDTIIINGVKSLSGCEFSVMPDRIVTATYMSACAITGGELLIKKTNVNDIYALIPVFEQMGCKILPFDDNLYINAKKYLKPVRLIRTMPFPGFPTDAQATTMAALIKAEGTSVIVENIFESRYRHVDELVRMGAKIKTEGKVSIIEGVKRLYGANVRATDLRGGAALVVAALSAEGQTTISDIHFVDRGYESIETSLNSVGAKIKRI